MLLRLAPLCVVMSLLTSVASAQETGPDKLALLLRNAPSAPNSIAYLNVDSLKRLMSEANMDSTVSDRVSEAWLVAHLDAINHVPHWEAGYTKPKVDPGAQRDVQTLAKDIGGYVDSVAGKDVVWTPMQSYLLPSEHGIQFLRPSNRSMLSKWLKAHYSSVSPSAYLEKQATQTEDFLSFLFAVDMEDAFSPITLGSRLEQFESLKDIPIATSTRVLSSVKGMSVIVGRRSLAECIVSFEFGDSPEPLLPVANALLNEVLNRNGTAAPEVKTWKASQDGNAIKLQGAISEDTLNGLLGIFSIERHSDSVARSGQKMELSSTGGAVKTKAYFDKVTKIIDRVRKYDAQTTGYRAKWNDQNARRIDQLDTIGVDKEMIQYGAAVSELLRQNAMAIRGLNVRSGQQQAEAGLNSGGYEYNTGGYYGFYGGSYGNVRGYYDPNTSADYQRVIGAQARGAGFGSFRNTLSEIDKITGDIRRKMEAKYKTAF